MTTEHKNLSNLKLRFEDGDRPTGEDFERLIDSCHNTRQLTDVTITKSLSVQDVLTVDGKINTRDVVADGAKLDSLDSFVRSNSDSWEETDHILQVNSTVVTVSSVLASNINSLNYTLSTYVDDNVSILNGKIDTNVSSLSNQSITNHTEINQALESSVDQLNGLITNNYTELDGKIDTIESSINEKIDTVNVTLTSKDLELLNLITNNTNNITNTITTVSENSAAWGVDLHTNELSGMVDVYVDNARHNDVLKYDSVEKMWYPATDLHGEGQHVDTFVEMHDTPVTYTGANKFVKISETNDRLIFVEHDTDSWDLSYTLIKTNSANWAEQTDVTDLTTTVRTNSANWADHTDVTDLTTTVRTNSANWADHTDVTDLTTTVRTNSANWADHTDVTDITNGLDNVTTTVKTNSAQWAEQTDVTDLTTTVRTNSANWADHTDVTDLTTTVHTNSANWADHTDVTDITNGLDNVTTTVRTNSANWADHTDVTSISDGLDNVTTTVKTNSANWAVLDINGKLETSQIPELSITRVHTVQAPSDVEILSPGTGIQPGDIVVVQSSYDNLIAMVKDPDGVYDVATKTYTQYNKLAVPAASVNTVNGEFGPNVIISTDDISDVDQDNKWVAQDDINRWNSSTSAFVNVSGDELTGDLNTTAKILSGGVELHDIFSINTNINGDQVVNGDQTVTGTINTTRVNSSMFSTAGKLGITQDVNVGGNILHIENGIIIGVTDAQ